MKVISAEFLQSFFSFIWNTIIKVLEIPVLPGFSEGDYFTRGELLFSFMLVSLAFAVIFSLFGFHPGSLSSINETFKQRDEKVKYNSSKSADK